MRRAQLTSALLLLNALLLAVVLWQAYLLRHQPGRTGTPEQAIDRTSGNGPSGAPSGATGAPADQEAGINSARPGETVASPRLLHSGSSASTNGPALDWRQVESEDYRTYIQNLRAIGCPEPTIRDIVTADLLQAFAAKRAEVMATRYKDFQFWKTGPEETAARVALEAQHRAVDDEMGGILRELLGADAVLPGTASSWRQAELQQLLQFLPPDKRQPALATLLQYAETDQQARTLADGNRLPEDPQERAHVLEAYARKQTALAALLTPAEYEQVDMTVSWTADNLRRAMAQFGPTEEEFRVIFRAWRPHDENLTRLYATGQPDPGNTQVFDKIRQALGEERFQQYQSTWWK